MRERPEVTKVDLTEAEGEDGSGIYRLLPGVALRMFDASMILQVRGENVLYVNVADKGIVTVTGCGHPGIMNLLGFARDRLAAPALYGCYGGLHLRYLEAGVRYNHRRGKTARHGEDGLQPLHWLDVGGEGGNARRADH